MSEIKTRIENATAELAIATQTIHDLPNALKLNIYTQTTEPTSK